MTKPLGFILIFLVAWGASAQEGQRPAPGRTVTVHGEGSINVTPDQVRLSVQINIRGESATAAMGEANARTSAVLTLLKSMGVDAKDIQTSRATVNAIIDYQKNVQPPPIIGYTGINEFSVVLKGKLMEKVGDFLDRGISAGASSFGALAYESSARRGLEREALKKAADDAQARASVLAQQLGATLGEVRTITESTGPIWPMVRSGLMDAQAASAPVMSGELSINAQVTVVFELK